MWPLENNLKDDDKEVMDFCRLYVDLIYAFSYKSNPGKYEGIPANEKKISELVREAEEKFPNISSMNSLVSRVREAYEIK